VASSTRNASRSPRRRRCWTLLRQRLSSGTNGIQRVAVATTTDQPGGPVDLDHPLAVGGHGHLAQQATNGGDGRGGQGVAVGVDADDAIHPISQHGHRCCSSSVDGLVPAWGHRTANL
jgi:hypothetical protein